MKRVFVWSAFTIAALAIGLASGGIAEARPRCSSGCAPCAPAPSCGVQYQIVQRTVMVPEQSWEIRQVPVTVCRPEVRQQEVTVMREVVEVKAVTRQYTVMETQQKVRVENYTVVTPVWRNVDRQVTEMVPEVVVRQGVRRVCRAVQVQEMRTVCRDQGHWEERQVVSNCDSSCNSCGRRCGRRARCNSCGGCTSPCEPTVSVCRVWVPNIVQEQVPVMVTRNQMFDEPYQYNETVCKPVVKNVVDRVCEYKREQKSREIPYTVCVPKVMSKTEDVKFTRCVPEKQMRDVTVMVPRTEMKEVRVSVCKMVPKVIECRVPVCEPGCSP